MESGDGIVDAADRRTLFEVEREKRWRIWALFGLLLALAFVSAWGACLVVALAVSLAVAEPLLVSRLFTPAGVGIVLGVSFAVSLVYWGLSRIGARRRLLAAMHCRPLDRGDRYHERLADIVEEMRLATGAPRVDCVTVRTVGLNAFAFSDLRGGGVIGVTEGALARLSRQELQAVVAHEFAQVLSGSCVTVTVSCLLFGIYSSLAERLDDVVDSSSDADVASAVVAMVPLRGWLWLMQLASSVVNAAISRQRELQADLAAVRYTRDPLALAEALRVIGRHPGGAGYIPEGLAPLCIRATGTLGWPAVSWRDTHPPLDDRIQALLGVANVSRTEFERQALQAADDFDRREHWTPAPAGTALPLATAVPAGTGVRGPTALAPSRVASEMGAGMTCPSCGAGLVRIAYEGIDVVACERCGGRLVSTLQIGKLLARREAGFTADQRRLADLVSASGDRLRRAAVLARGRPGLGLIACPKCAAPMMRRHYSYEYAIEVDRCVPCDLVWFEKDELEALQILVERESG